MRVIIFTDLDGSLLNNETFKFDEIKNFIINCLKKGIKLIPNTSKTSFEILEFIKELDFEIPYIAENGSSIHNLNILSPHLSDEIVLARPVREIYEDFTKNIKKKLLLNCNFLSQMDTEKQSSILGLSGRKLELALNRNYTFLITFNGEKNEIKELIEYCHNLGLSFNQGGRVICIGDKVDKLTGMKKILKIIKSNNEFKDIFTIGVGDSPNDLGMLDEVNFPCLIKRKNNENILNKDKYTISTKEAPNGWMEVVKIGLEKSKLII